MRRKQLEEQKQMLLVSFESMDETDRSMLLDLVRSCADEAKA